MADLSRYRELSRHERIMALIAVLLDGQKGGFYLRSDKERAGAYDEVCSDLVHLNPELRLPLLGTLLRTELMSFGEKSSG